MEEKSSKYIQTSLKRPEREASLKIHCTLNEERNESQKQQN
jgi:hypothetical protein